MHVMVSPMQMVSETGRCYAVLWQQQEQNSCARTAVTAMSTQSHMLQWKQGCSRQARAKGASPVAVSSLLPLRDASASAGGAGLSIVRRPRHPCLARIHVLHKQAC